MVRASARPVLKVRVSIRGRKRVVCTHLGYQRIHSQYPFEYTTDMLCTSTQATTVSDGFCPVMSFSLYKPGNLGTVL